MRFQLMAGAVFAAAALGAAWAVGFVTRHTSFWRLCLVLANAAVVFGLPLAWRSGAAWGKAAVQCTAVFLMAEALFCAFVFCGWLFRFAADFFSGPLVEFDEKRRHLLKAALLYPAAAILGGLYGGFIERTRTVINRHEVPVEGAAGLKGYSLVQLSDVHLGAFFTLDDLRDLLEQAVKVGGEALCLTGDVFDDDALNAAAAEIIDGYCARFPDGIWYIYGNHEHFRNLAAVEKALAKTKIRVLKNSAGQVAKHWTGGDKPLYLVGVDYPMRREKFAALAAEYMEVAYKDVPQNAVTVLLAHHSDFIDDGAARGAAAVLTGHTHGGQIGLFGVSLAPHIFKYMRGVYKVGRTFGYVHTGNGSWFPFRLGCPPEIAVFKLV